MASTVNPVNGSDYFGVTAPKAKDKLDMNTFMRLLTVQLANQNPLEPMNDRDFFAQMAQLGQVQGTDKMINKLDVIQATSLMGKSVSALRTMTTSGSNGQNSIVTGVVKSMSVRNGTYYLNLQDDTGGITEITFDNIQSINS